MTVDRSKAPGGGQAQGRPGPPKTHQSTPLRPSVKVPHRKRQTKSFSVPRSRQPKSTAQVLARPHTRGRRSTRCMAWRQCKCFPCSVEHSSVRPPAVDPDHELPRGSGGPWDCRGSRSWVFFDTAAFWRTRAPQPRHQPVPRRRLQQPRHPPAPTALARLAGWCLRPGWCQRQLLF